MHARFGWPDWDFSRIMDVRFGSPDNFAGEPSHQEAYVLNRPYRSLPWYRWLRWGDYLLYILIAIAALALFSQGPLLDRAPGNGQSAKITVDGFEVMTIPADQLARSGSFELDANGFHYTVEYEAGRIRISQADCPDQVCVQTGWVSRLGQVSACVPGHLILSVDGSPAGSGSGPSDQEVDVIIG